MKGSWKTTTAGILAAIAAVANAGLALLDGNPETNPDWVLVVSLVATAIGLNYARDNDVSSEQAGAKKEPKSSVSIASNLSIVLLAGLLCSGCAKFSGNTTRKFEGTNLVSEVVHFRGFTILDGKAKLAEANAGLTKTTAKVGVTGSDMESSGESVVKAIEKLPSGIADVLKKSVTP